MSTTTPLDPCPCPACGKLCDAATGATGTAPKPGDVAICWGCAEVLEYADDLSLVLCVDPAVRSDRGVILYRSEVIAYHATKAER